MNVLLNLLLIALGFWLFTELSWFWFLRVFKFVDERIN